MSLHYNDDLEASTQHLRKVLPLMTRYGVPITPPNYAVWYEYVCEDNPVLRDRIDEILKKHNQFSDELMLDLFNNHVVEISEEQLLAARNQLDQLTTEVGQSLNLAGSNIQNYQAALDSCTSCLETAHSPSTLLDVITRISDETGAVQKANQELQEKLDAARREAEKLKSELQEARNHALTDALTSVANRQGFNAALQALKMAEEFDSQPHAFLMVDIDHFKAVNDTHGHLIGDKVIRFVANTITKCVKGNDIVSRFGGEELAVFLPNTSLDNARRVAENIRTTIEKGKLIKAGSGEQIGQVTVSIGVAAFNPEAKINTIINKADEALYAAKAAGRNQVMLSEDL